MSSIDGMSSDLTTCLSIVPCLLCLLSACLFLVFDSRTPKYSACMSTSYEPTGTRRPWNLSSMLRVWRKKRQLVTRVAPDGKQDSSDFEISRHEVIVHLPPAEHVTGAQRAAKI
eukprot:g28185.t1